MFKLFQVYFYMLLILFSLRYTIKGIHNLIFYGLPTYPHFYSEVCNMLQADVREGGGSVSFTCTALYSRYDMHRLAAVTGADRAAQMLQSKKTVHLFITGEEKNTWRGTLKIDWHFQPQTKNIFPVIPVIWLNVYCSHVFVYFFKYKVFFRCIHSPDLWLQGVFCITFKRVLQ